MTSNLPAFHYDFEPLDPETVASLSMSTKEVGQVSAICTLLVAQVPFSDNLAHTNSFMEKLQDSLFCMNTAALKHVCRSLDCLSKKRTQLYKIDYAAALIQWVGYDLFNMNIVTEFTSLNSPHWKRRQQPLVAVDKDTHQPSSRQALERVRDVIRDTSVPTWLGSVPKNFGDTSAGTIKADKWRQLITIYLPIMLISLWGTGSKTNPRLLHHTMDLVSAVYLACARSMTLDRASAYRSPIVSYVGSLKRLHPTIDLHPNHHATFHIYNYLLLFGSVQSWWTFPFECLIGVLQCLPSNHKSGALFHRDGTYTLTRILGELEVMMLQSYLKGAKLQTWLSCPDCPSTIRECKYSSIELTRHPMPTKMMTVSFQVIFQSRPLYPRICSCLWDSARWHYVLISSTLLVFITAIPRPMLATHSSCSIHLAISSFY